MRILHIYETPVHAVNAFNELKEHGEIGAKFNTNEVTVSYNNMILHFVGLDQIIQTFDGIHVDSVSYHDVEPEEELELFLMGRMND